MATRPANFVDNTIADQEITMESGKIAVVKVGEGITDDEWDHIVRACQDIFGGHTVTHIICQRSLNGDMIDRTQP